jgi:hypothetical protein|tara:strand:- start:1712 stop:2281 length:570 start_codon:yes stop_codon:yes gene_type:complete
VTNQLRDKAKRAARPSRSQTASILIREVTTKAGIEAARLKNANLLKVDVIGIFPLGRHSPRNRRCHTQYKGRYLRKELLGDLRSIHFLCNTSISPVVIARVSQVATKKGAYSSINSCNLTRVAVRSVIYQPRQSFANITLTGVDSLNIKFMKKTPSNYARSESLKMPSNLLGGVVHFHLFIPYFILPLS